MLIVLAGCSVSLSPTSTPPSADATTTTATTTPPLSSTTSTTGPAIEVPEPIVGFGLATVRLDGVELLVAVADTPELRRQGLMGVEDLGDLAGMLFVFAEDTTGGFWMKDTLLPLDIAFFTADGAVVDSFSMEPCTTQDCPTYRPSGAYRYALELPAGGMPESATVLDLSG